MSQAKRVLLFGAGRMGGAMLERWVEKGRDPKTLSVIDIAPDAARQKWMREKGVSCFESAASYAASEEKPSLILMAVKPDALLPLMEEIAREITLAQGGIILSIAAGIRLADFMAPFTPPLLGLRAMPNTPALVGEGASVIVSNRDVSAEEKAFVEELFSPLGALFWEKEEALLDAVTALSGSGPAYCFHLCEAMEEAGVALGLPPILAKDLARQTIIGAGAMLQKSGEGAAALREQVTSPGGTTQAALKILMQRSALSELMERAMRAAKARGEEMSQEN